MNIDKFMKLKAGDRVEPLKTDYLIEVASIEGNGFLKDSQGFIWHRSNLKDRVFLGVSKEVFDYLNHDFINLPTLVLQHYNADGASDEHWPQELKDLYRDNQDGLFDAVLHNSFFLKRGE